MFSRFHLSLLLIVRASDKRISCDEEFSDSEDEGEGGRRNRESFKHRKRLKVNENGEKKDADEKGETPRVTQRPFTKTIGSLLNMWYKIHKRKRRNLHAHK